MTCTRLGKIENVYFGMGGYQNAMLGVTFVLSTGNIDFKGYWGSDPDPDAKWGKEDQINALGNVALEIGNILRNAQVDTLDQLIGMPIEVTYDGVVGPMLNWRILHEVL